MSQKKHHRSLGQALVEFALIATVLLMIIFLIVEASRILWAWITVQNASREGVRYAITGQEEVNCPIEALPKFSDKCDLDKRVASIIGVTHTSLSGLPLNEESGTFEDDNYYIIEVWGVNEYLQVQPDYAGVPNQPVVVRVIYRVPIITPLFRPILESIPVFGQSVLNNEPFGSLGGTGQSAGAPPAIPPLPTPGVTPSVTPTETPGDTPTSTATPTASLTPPIPACPVQFRGALVADTTFANVTGTYRDDPLYFVSFIDITDANNPINLGTAFMFANTGEPLACPGIGSANGLNPPLIAGHTILAVHDDGSTDVEVVQQGTSTPTPTPSFTPTPTPSATPLPVDTATPTPSSPFIVINPTCGFEPTTTVNIAGANWPTNKTISLFWNGSLREQISAPHDGTIIKTWPNLPVVNGQTYTVMASAPGEPSSIKTFTVPCINITPTPAGATSTPTPAPADLVIVGQPVLVSTPPIVAYQPVQIQVAITNTGQVDVSSQFFVDIFFDPTVVYTDHIPIEFSSGYIAVGSLAGGASQVITITSPIGFDHTSPNLAYGMVDSLRTAPEILEDNNISSGLPVSVTPANTPTPSVTPGGDQTVSGVIRSFIGSSWVPQNRAAVWLVRASDGGIEGVTQSDENGFYSFSSAPSNVGLLTVVACLDVAGDFDFVGSRPGITPPNLTANAYMMQSATGCPYP